MICAVAWSQANGGSAARDVSADAAPPVSNSEAVQHASDSAAANHDSDSVAALRVSDSAVAQHVSDPAAAQRVSNTGAAHGANTAAAHLVPNTRAAYRVANTNAGVRVPNAGAASRIADTGAANLIPNTGPAHFVPDTDAAHFRYYGRWEHVHHMRDGRMFGSSSRTASPASSVTFFFDGTQARIYGVRGPGGGRGVLTIDGDHYFDVDFYAPKKIPQVVIYSTPILRKGRHFLVITPEAYPRTPHYHSSYINISGASFQ